VNLGSFVFCAVASCGWQNTEVPKFAVGRGGKSGLYLLETVIWNRLRVSANGCMLAMAAKQLLQTANLLQT